MRNDTIICSYTVYVFFSRLFLFLFSSMFRANTRKKKREENEKLCPRKTLKATYQKLLILLFSLSLLRSFSCMMVELKFFAARNENDRLGIEEKGIRLTTKNVIRKSTKSNFTLAFDNETIARISFFAFCAKS